MNGVGAADRPLGAALDLQRYLLRLDRASLVPPVEFDHEARQPFLPGLPACMLCNAHSPGYSLRLNHGRILCEICLAQVQRQRYPEEYQRRHEAFLATTAARESALADFSRGLDEVRRRSQLEPLQRIVAMAAWAGAAGTLLAFYAGRPALVIWSGGGTATLVAVWIAISAYMQRLSETAERKIALASRDTPAPVPPTLKHFHEPGATLTTRDRMVLEIFDHWPGLPPYWDYVRSIVLRRDGDHCRVACCPSRTTLHVHHRIRRAEGGSHRIDNLVTLCMFHHGLQPRHERILGEVRTHFFSMVRAHLREGNPVRAHIRRRELVRGEEVSDLIRYYQLACRSCAGTGLSVNESGQAAIREVVVRCTTCGSEWEFQPALTEEVGLQLAEVFDIRANAGLIELDPKLLPSVRPPRVRDPDARVPRKRTHRSRASRADSSARRCPRCGEPLVQKDGKYGIFLSCKSFPTCRYSRNADPRH